MSCGDVRLRIGNQALKLWIRLQTMRNKRVTTESAGMLERVSKQDLSNFFDFWIHGGFIPRLTVYTRLDKTEDGFFLDALKGLAFGLFDVPGIKEKKRYRCRDQHGARIWFIHSSQC